MRRILSSAIALGIALIVPIANTIPVGAIESFGIGAVPANPRADNARTKSIFVYEIKPGQTINDAVKLINNSSDSKTIKVYPVDSQPSSDGAFACAQAVDERKAVGSWMTLAKPEVTLAPGTNENVPFTLTVPETAGVGEHNGCIAVQDVSPTAKSQTENGIVLSFRSALRVAVTVPGKIETKLSLLEVKLDQNANKIQISPILKNTGNVSLDTDINVLVKNVFGGTAGAANGKFPVLTATTSRFNFEIDRPFWGGWYIQEVKANYVPLTDAGNSNKSVDLVAGKKWIFVAPHPTAAAIEIGAAVVLFATATYLFVRRRNHRQLKASTVEYKVRDGDDIQTVASSNNISWKLLAKLNQLKAPYTLQAGSTILVPQKPRKNGKKTAPGKG